MVIGLGCVTQCLDGEPAMAHEHLQAVCVEAAIILRCDLWGPGKTDPLPASQVIEVFAIASPLRLCGCPVANGNA